MLILMFTTFYCHFKCFFKSVCIFKYIIHVVNLNPFTTLILVYRYSYLLFSCSDRNTAYPEPLAVIDIYNEVTFIVFIGYA